MLHIRRGQRSLIASCPTSRRKNFFSALSDIAARTGITTEHVFVFAYGTGANGKSTFINTIVKLLGDYATIADVGTFMPVRSLTFSMT